MTEHGDLVRQEADLHENISSSFTGDKAAYFLQLAENRRKVANVLDGLPPGEPEPEPEPVPEPEPEPSPTKRLDGAFVASSPTLGPWPGQMECKDFHGANEAPTSVPGKINMWPWAKPAEPRTTETLRRASEGAFDSYVISFCRSIRSKTGQPIHVGHAHEGNTPSKSTQPWAFLSNPGVEIPLFKKMFNHNAPIIRRELPTAKVYACFGAFGNITVANLKLWVPEEADGLMMDVYDRCPNCAGLSPQARWDKRHKPQLDAVEAYVRERRSGGKPFLYAIGEYGLAQTSENGGGDNPLFMTNLFRHANLLGCGPMCYHHSDQNVGGASANHDLNDYPKALAEYKKQVLL